MLGLQLLGDLLGGDGTEELAAGAALGGDLHLAALQLPGKLLCGGLGLCVGLGLGLGLQLHGVHGIGGSQHRQIFRKQEVAGVALGYLDHLALLALTPDILLQNHFHGNIPPYSSKYLSMARSSVVFASATVMPEHWPPAVVELPPPPSVSTSTCTLISPRERAEM